MNEEPAYMGKISDFFGPEARKAVDLYRMGLADQALYRKSTWDALTEILTPLQADLATDLYVSVKMLIKAFRLPENFDGTPLPQTPRPAAILVDGRDGRVVALERKREDTSQN
jgi:hypothetical protein